MWTPSRPSLLIYHQMKKTLLRKVFRWDNWKKGLIASLEITYLFHNCKIVVRRLQLSKASFWRKKSLLQSVSMLLILKVFIPHIKRTIVATSAFHRRRTLSWVRPNPVQPCTANVSCSLSSDSCAQIYSRYTAFLARTKAGIARVNR